MSRQPEALLDPDNYSSTPSGPADGDVRQVGCASIETHPDGVIVKAILPRRRYWLRVAGHGALALLLIGIALPSADQGEWGGFHLQREGMPARIVSGLLGTWIAIVVGINLLRPRVPATLVVRCGLFAYSEPKIRGQAYFACPLPDVEAIDHQPWDGDSGGTLSIKIKGGRHRRLFRDLNAKEIEAIAGAITPVWKGAAAGGAA